MLRRFLLIHKNKSLCISWPQSSCRLVALLPRQTDEEVILKMKVIKEAVLKINTCVSTADKVEVLFELIRGLIMDLDGDSDELDEEDFNEEQNSVGRVIPMLYNDDPEEMLETIYTVRKHIWVDDQGGVKDGERVLLCLKRSLRIANAAQQMASVARGSSGPVTLFVEILNKYLYFFEKGNPQVTNVAIEGLIELIRTEMQSDTVTPDRASDAFFTSTLSGRF